MANIIELSIWRNVGSVTSGDTSIFNVFFLLPTMHLNFVSTVTWRSAPLSLEATFLRYKMRHYVDRISVEFLQQFNLGKTDKWKTWRCPTFSSSFLKTKFVISKRFRFIIVCSICHEILNRPRTLIYLVSRWFWNESHFLAWSSLVFISWWQIYRLLSFSCLLRHAATRISHLFIEVWIKFGIKLSREFNTHWISAKQPFRL